MSPRSSKGREFAAVCAPMRWIPNMPKPCGRRVRSWWANAFRPWNAGVLESVCVSMGPYVDLQLWVRKTAGCECPCSQVLTEEFSHDRLCRSYFWFFLAPREYFLPGRLVARGALIRPHERNFAHTPKCAAGSLGESEFARFAPPRTTTAP